MDKQTTGQHAEQLACDYLIQQGMKLRCRNFRCKQGEIDLIMQDANCIVFVEVRFRKHTDFGSGAETVDHRKRQKLITTAQHYLQQSHSHRYACRFDVISISGELNKASIDWISNAFDA
jgi:putative endonuclease